MSQPFGADSPANAGNDLVDYLTEIPTDYNIIDGQWNRYYRAAKGHEEWARVAKTCVEFFEGQQWSADELRVLREEGRPEITINKISPLVRLIFGYFRQNRYDIKYLPGHDGTGTMNVSDVLNALEKQVAEMNQSDWKDAEMFQDGIQTGRGYIDTRLDFSKNMLGDLAEQTKDPFSIYLDPEAQSYDPNESENGWGYFIESRWLSPTEIFTLFGEKSAQEVISNIQNQPLDSQAYDYAFAADIMPKTSFGLDYFMSGQYDQMYGLYSSPFHHVNRTRKLIRVLDCQHKILKQVNYFLDLETGVEKVIPEGFPREKIARIIEYANLKGYAFTVRTGLRPQIRWTVTAGDRVLYDKWSPYERYTIVPYFPYFRRGQTRGMIHDLLDPQREINRRRAAFLHIVMSTANSGWMFEEGSLDDDMQRAIEEYGARPGINIEYREGYQAPVKIQPSASPMAVKQLEMDASNDLKEISSINDSALGNLDRVQSGKAIQARQRQAIMGAEMYFDNYSRTRELKGRNHLSIFQSYYNEPRIIRVTGADGTLEQHAINQREAAGEIVNNVQSGTYSVAIDQTPISATHMQSQFDEAMELREKGVPVPDDILVDMSSMPRKDEIKKRIDEQRLLQQDGAVLENMGVRGSMGIPPNVPLPPIAMGGSPVQVVEGAPNGAMPMPPMAAPPPAPQPTQPPMAPLPPLTTLP